MFITQRGQRCDADIFSCQYNDPCNPRCVPEQFFYPGRGPRWYVGCRGGKCTDLRCPRRTTWNQTNQRCEGNHG